MATGHEGPLFNLGAVVLQTGLRPDTLRAWERRYGLPTPDRSAGRHRLYSPQDIQSIQWLIARQHEGLSISRAVELWRQIEASGRDPLQVPAPAGSLAVPGPALRAVGDTLLHLREEWLAACKAFDEHHAEEVLSTAFALFPPDVVCVELMQKALVEIGAAWYRGEASVSQEHFASALAARRLESLILSAYLLRRRGWMVVYLGANLPVDQLKSAVAALQPQLVILAAQLLPTAATLLEAAQALAGQHVPLAYGGLVFNGMPALRSRIPGHFLGETVESAAQAAEALMVGPKQAPAAVPAAQACHVALDHLRDREGFIQARLGEAGAALGIPPRSLEVANREIALHIKSALALGDIDLMRADLGWVEGLLRHHGVPAAVLPRYLRAYHGAARAVLDERGGPIVAWLGRFLGT
jgi:DNA-binding transcriptional MerR regulator